jgi:hypothetical protein
MIQRANASGPEQSRDPKYWRWVFNGIKLNDITPNKFSLQLPTSAEVSNLVNVKVVSSVDLWESFHTIPLTKETQLKCSFYWRNSKYSYARLAMGLKNACTYLSDALDKSLMDEALESFRKLHPEWPEFNPRKCYIM